MEKYVIRDAHPLEVDVNERMPLSFFVSEPKKMDENTQPIVVLHGYGMHASNEYITSLHRSLTEKYNVAIITVNYAGTFTKCYSINDKQTHDFINLKTFIRDEESKKNLLTLIDAILKNPEATEQHLKSSENIYPEIKLAHFNRLLSLLKHKINHNLCDGLYVLERLFEMGFKKTFIQFLFNIEGDHQDFGLIQAIDVLTAVKELKESDKYKNINWSKLSITGSSHGSYIASMCDKLAPNTFYKVVNNAGWVSPNMPDVYNGFYEQDFVGVKYTVEMQNYWSENPEGINFFDEQHKEIRTLANDIHIDEQFSFTNKPENKEYIFIHTLNDHLIPLDDKDRYIEMMKPKNYNINYIRLVDEKQLDGQTLKTLNHAADGSIKGLVIDYIINNENNKDVCIEEDDFTLKSKLTYTCSKGKYIIDFDNKYPKVSFIKEQ